ncbi:DUF2695 domain-containing protein [Pseudoduganella namucuonensis]|uniref:DUF2695 domain-containing protein n=1 Tax=Pseudoduganella namucuonensis TaxID=1035707 RepID=UPI000B84824E|nr:DUF2695 domain-containing protein [Pseudoduganella namucuonensis]
MDNADRNRKRAWKNEQRTLARSAFPLPSEALEQLFTALDSSLEQSGCDHTLRFTDQWLAANVSDREPTIAWLKSHGGFCDCEVIANVCDHWAQNR